MVFRCNTLQSLLSLLLSLISFSFFHSELNPCDSDPCQNGGSCYKYFGQYSYICACPDGYDGTDCETGNCFFFLSQFIMCIIGNIRTVLVLPRFLWMKQIFRDMNLKDNSLFCVFWMFFPTNYHEESSYSFWFIKSKSDNPHVSVLCVELDPCDSQPCQNGGNCFRSGDAYAYICSCLVGYDGTNCETGKTTTRTIFFIMFSFTMFHDFIKLGWVTSSNVLPHKYTHGVD